MPHQPTNDKAQQMFKSLLNSLRSRFPQLSETDFEFAKNSHINVDAIEARRLKGAELNKLLCRSALTGSELPLNWWERDDAEQIHARISVRLPALENLSPSFYGRKAQDGQRGFIMAAQTIGSQATHYNVSLLTQATDIVSFWHIERKLDLH